MKTLALTSLAFGLTFASSFGQTVFHYRVNDTDAAGLPAVPSVGGSPGEAQGTFSGLLSDDVPTVGVPIGAGNRSLVGAGAADSDGVNSANLQELLNDMVVTAGGFTFEAWFKWNGGGTVNSIIDYAGTEKFRIHTGLGGNLDMNFDSGSGATVLVNAPTVGEWHYVAMVFEHDGNAPVNNQIGGTMTWYYDDNEPAGSATVTKDDFGDSLNRFIGVGRHPNGFGGDNFDGLIYEPRVSLGALSAGELLFQPLATDDPQIRVAPTVSEQGDGTASTISLQVTNLPGTTLDLVLGTPTLSGANADLFAVGAVPASIAPDGGMGEIEVRFLGALDGEYTATLTIPSNDPVQSEVEVVLNVSVRDPAVEMDAFIDFGTQAIGSPEQGSFTVRNLGGVTWLGLSDHRITGPGAAAFTLGAVPTAIAPGANIPLEVFFNPPAGGIYIAQVLVDTTDPRNPTVGGGLIGFADGPIDLEGPSKLSHWTFDDPDNLGDDSGGLDYDGTVVGDLAATELAAVGQGAVALDGDADYIEIAQGAFGYHQMAYEGNGFTVAVWVCSSPEGEPNRQRYFSKLFDTGGGGIGVGQNLDAQFIATTYGVFDYLGGTPPVQDEWHHMAFVFRNAPPDTVDYYVDGVLNATVSGTPGLNAGGGTYAIGGLGAGPGEWFDGLLDDLRVYGVELSGNEIATLASMGTPGPHVPAGPPLAITSVSREGDTLTITWNSREGAFYAVNYSTDLEDWGGEFDDSIPGDAGDETTRSFDLAGEGLADEETLFLRVSIP